MLRNKTLGDEFQTLWNDWNMTFTKKVKRLNYFLAFKNTLGGYFKSQPSCSDTAVVAIDICDSTFFCLPNEIQKYAQCQGVSFFRGNETFCL